MAELHFTAAELRARLDVARAALRESRLAHNTHRAYRYDWGAFEGFCGRMEITPLPASAETLSLFITEQLESGHTVTTATRRVASVLKMHQQAGMASPATADIRALLKCARRARLEQPRQVRPLGVEELRRASIVLAQRGSVIDLRDRAILVVGFASALRSANLVMLRSDDVEFAERGLVLRVRKSKTDQEGRGRLIGCPHGRHPETCAVRCLQTWMDVRKGSLEGPLFSRVRREQWSVERPMRPIEICRIVRRAVSLIGADNPKQYGGHSLRAGFVTAAGEANVAELLIAQQTGHQNLAMVRQYFRKRDLWRANPCGSIDL